MSAPLTSDDVIFGIAMGRADRGLPTFVPATDKDFLAVCTDADGDEWALFPVAELDERGEVMSVHWRRGNIEPLYRVRKRKPQMLVRAAIIADRDAVRQLCWTPHKGLLALREAIRPHIDLATAKADPQS